MKRAAIHKILFMVVTLFFFFCIWWRKTTFFWNALCKFCLDEMWKSFSWHHFLIVFNVHKLIVGIFKITIQMDWEDNRKKKKDSCFGRNTFFPSLCVKLISIIFSLKIITNTNTWHQNSEIFKNHIPPPQKKGGDCFSQTPSYFNEEMQH